MATYGSGVYGTAVYGGDPAQFGVDDLRVDLWRAGGALTGTWVECTTDVRTEEGITLNRGRGGESDTASTAQCNLTLDNRSGKYSPRNTSGALYGEIRRNNPIRVGLGNPVMGRVGVGNGTTLTAPQLVTDYPTVGVWFVGHILGVQNLTTPAGYGTATETDTASFTYRRARATDGIVVNDATSTASVGGDWAAAHLAVPNGTLSLEVTGNAQDGAACTASIAHTGAAVATAVCFWSQDQYGRMNPPKFTGQLEPVEMYIVADTGPSTGPRCMVWAWEQTDTQNGTAVLEGALDGTTDSSITIAFWTGADAFTPRFTGEIADWPQAWDPTESLWTTPITAGGALRRLGASQDVVSPLRGSFLGSAGILAYWPLEDPAGSLTYAPSVGGQLLRPVVGVPQAATFNAVSGSQPLPGFQNAALHGSVSGSSAAGWGFGAVVSFGDTDDFFPIVAAGSDLASLVLGAFTSTSSLNLFVNTAGGSGFVSVASTFPFGMLNRQAFVYVAMAQSGANITYSVTVHNITPGENTAVTTFGGTVASLTLGKITGLYVGYDTLGGSPGIEPFSIGHAFVTSGTTLVEGDYKADAGRGWDGVLITEAAERTARDAGFKLTSTTEATFDTLEAGPVLPGPAQENLKGLEVAGQAVMADAAGFVGLDWRPYGTLITQSPVFTLDYAAGTLTGRLGPVDDDAKTLNDVTVNAWNGAGHVVRTTGALGAQASGIGRYSSTFTVPTRNATTAQDLAGWLTGIGTLDAARWPTLTLEMIRTGNALLDLPTFSLGDVITVTNLPPETGPTTVNLQVVGFEEAFTSRLYRLTVHTRLDAAWSVLIWGAGDWDEHVWGL